METEADLSAPVQLRRRSSSFSDDYSVQKTNDDASQSKLAAVQLGYWKDDFLKRFVSHSVDETQVARRDPEISIGYWSRVAVIRHFLSEFLAKFGDQTQIISLGCGFDTLYWRLKHEGVKFARYVEVDFSSVTAKKIRVLSKPSSADLVKLFSKQPEESQHADLHAGDYHLVGADLRQLDEVRGKLEAAGVDWKAPTIVIAECVLIYMAVSQSEALLSELAKAFDNIALLSYEQVNTADEFGRIMVENLENRGLRLMGLPACANIETQKDRLRAAGFTHGHVMDMQEAYVKLLKPEEKKRVTAIEGLDEMELLRQLQEHYSISYVAKAPNAETYGLPKL